MENQTDEQLNDLIAQRLVAKAQAHNLNPIGETHPAAPAERPRLSKVEFIKVEKNLASLGFFTPSSKRVRNEKAKTITFVKVIDGKRVEARATIVPGALYGLPITADQDKYLALQKIVNDLQQERGRIAVSSQGHINQSVQVRPRPPDSGLVAGRRRGAQARR